MLKFIKVFAALFAVLLFLALVGIVLPVLFSSKSTLGVVLGLLIVLLLTAFGINYVINKLFKQ